MRKAAAIVAVVVGLLATAPVALADGNNPSNPGGATTGYEGHPGNQAHH